MDKDALPKVWLEIVHEAWADEEFKARLLENPREVFKERGIELTDVSEIRILEEAPGVSYFVLPLPQKIKLSLSDLEAVSGGSFNAMWVHYPSKGPFRKVE